MENNKIKFSILIKTDNSEETIVNTLESVCSFGEIIAVDTHSKDDTIEILNEYKVKIIYADKFNLTPALNQAIAEAKGDWVLVLEDDEIVSLEFLKNIENYAINPKNNKYSVTFNIETNCLNKKLNSAKKKNVLRFFRKDACEFKSNNIFELKTISGKVCNFPKKYCILKYLENDISKNILKILEKNKNIVKTKTNKKPSVIIKPILQFLYCYFLKFGFLEGQAGYTFAIQKAFERYSFELMLLERNIKEKKQ